MTLTVVTASLPAPAKAAVLQELPTLTVDPSCATVPPDLGTNVAITIHGSGFTPGQNIVLYALRSAVPGLGPITVQPNGTFDAAPSLLLSGFQSVEISAYDISATPDAGGTPVATYIFRVPCPSPTVTLSQTCANANEQLQLSITTTGYLTGVAMDIAIQNDSSAMFGHSTPTPDTDPYTTTLDVQPLGTGVYTVVVTQEAPVPSAPVILDNAPNRAVAYLTVPCAQLTIAPTCVSTQQQPVVINLTGDLFQPGLAVGVVFDPRVSDPAGQPQYFGYGMADDQGRWSAEITPYARGPGTYDVIAVQYLNDEQHTMVDLTHARTPLAIMDGACPAGQLTPNPTCANPLLTGDQPYNFALSVHGSGFQYGMVLTLMFDAEGKAGPEFPPEVSTQATVQPDGSADWTFPNGVAARPEDNYLITALDPNNTAVTQIPFSVPCGPPNAQLRPLKPRCDDDVTVFPNTSYTIEVRGIGFLPGYVDIRFDGLPQTPATADASGQFAATLMIDGVAHGTYQVVATQSDSKHTIVQVSRPFKVPCQNATVPTITINPGNVAPGFVVEVDGSGFPPASR